MINLTKKSYNKKNSFNLYDRIHIPSLNLRGIIIGESNNGFPLVRLDNMKEAVDINPRYIKNLGEFNYERI